MKLNANVLLIQLFLSLQLVAAGPDKTEVLGEKWKYMVFACRTPLALYKWGTNITSYYPKLCGYEPFTGSIVNCIANELDFGSNSFNKSMNRFSNTCRNYGKANYTLDDFYDMYHNASQYMLQTSDLKGLNLTKTKFYQPINITHTQIAKTLTYYEYFYFNFDKASMLAGIMYLYFVLVFIIVGTGNLIKRLGLQGKFNNRFINFLRTHISLPALFNGKHTEAPAFLKVFSTLLPTRMESIVVFLFFCLNILLTTVHYHFETSVEPADVQMMKFVADRTGLLSFGLIPLLIIFAGRNNILTTLTGIPYSTFIVFHKWVARFMWIHAMIHTAGWTAYAVKYKYVAYYSSQTYWQWGIVATILGGLILFQAFHVFRNMAYETFLFIHIVLAILFIVGCWWHCYSLGWLEWIYVSWAVWIFDRLLRVVRMSLFGFKNAEIQLIADDTFKITVKNSKWFAPFPGSFGYVYFITPTMFWQSHPFTIVESVSNKNESNIFVKTKKGITKRLNKQLAKLPDGKKTIRISVEGPYGHRAPVEKYDTVLLMAGGNGIPGPFHHAYDLSKRESSSKKNIKLNWVIRHPEALQWFQTELKALANTNVEVNVYITAPKTDEVDTSSNEEKKEASSDEAELKGQVKISNPADIISSLSSHVNFHHGRPNLEEIILNEFRAESGPSVAVMSCGPSKMGDSIRSLVAKHLNESKGRVDLFEESQVW